MSSSAYIITGIGLAFTAIVIVLIWVKFFRRRTMQRLMLEMEAARIARELEAAQLQAVQADAYERPASPKRPVVIKDAIVIQHPNGSTGFAYNTDDSDSDEGSVDGDAALRAKLQRGDEDAPAASTELSTVVVVSNSPPVARENTFEWVGTGPQLPPPPRILEEPPAAPPRRRWYHRRGRRDEASTARSPHPVINSTVLGAHDASAHPMALAFSFGG